MCNLDSWRIKTSTSKHHLEINISQLSWVSSSRPAVGRIGSGSIAGFLVKRCSHPDQCADLLYPNAAGHSQSANILTIDFAIGPRLLSACVSH